MLKMVMAQKSHSVALQKVWHNGTRLVFNDHPCIILENADLIRRKLYLNRKANANRPGMECMLPSESLGYHWRYGNRDWRTFVNYFAGGISALGDGGIDRGFALN